jgi:hypothetical protein
LAEEETLPSFALDSLINSEAFQENHKETLANALQEKKFRWVSEEETELRAANTRMTYQNLVVLEALYRFKGEQLSEIFLSLYNRGDAGKITDDSFSDFISQIVEKLNTLTSDTATDLEDPFKSTSVRSQSKAWVGQNLSFRLDTAYSKVKKESGGRREERPEFVNLTILPGNTSKDNLIIQRKADTLLVNFRERVKTDSSGDTLIEGIPMVDQGQKGYCAVATMERILRFYGSEVNQHELAQQANSDGRSGTDPESLVKALRNMSQKVGLRFTEQIAFDSKDFFEFVDDYNRAAKRKDKREIFFPRTGVIYVNDIYDKMDYQVVQELKIKKSSKVEKFFRDTTESIDQGRPLAWAVHLGWVEETPSLKQASGGHMRLIIGYNKSKNELLYSDSWGYGHELKRMSLNDAFTITKGLYQIEPKS